MVETTRRAPSSAHSHSLTCTHQHEPVRIRTTRVLCSSHPQTSTTCLTAHRPKMRYARLLVVQSTLSPTILEQRTSASLAAQLLHCGPTSNAFLVYFSVHNNQSQIDVILLPRISISSLHRVDPNDWTRKRSRRASQTQTIAITPRPLNSPERHIRCSTAVFRAGRRVGGRSKLIFWFHPPIWGFLGSSHATSFISRASQSCHSSAFWL
jgi:hypothetical protein